MDPTFYLTVFATLFVIVDPIGLTPIFVALTQGQSAAQRRSIALRSLFIAAFVLTLFALLGEAVLGFVGISMAAFRISGGLLLFLTALEMLFERRTKRREDQAEEEDHPDPSVFPLATPLIAGPGSIATIILLTGEASGDWGQIAVVILIMLGVLALTMLFFLVSGLLERALGRTGINVVTRLLGMLLAALSVQFVLDGLRDFGVVPV